MSRVKFPEINFWKPAIRLEITCHERVRRPQRKSVALMARQGTRGVYRRLYQHVRTGTYYVHIFTLDRDINRDEWYTATIDYISDQNWTDITVESQHNTN